MKEYMKPNMLIVMLDDEDVITTSSNWQDASVHGNEDIWEDFYN